MKAKPWEVTEHGRKVLQTEDELNAYIAAYGEMHIVKCRAALQNFPFDELNMYPFEIFDWGCGQGLATLTLLDMLSERNLLSRLRKIYLIEPSRYALNRAESWVKQNSYPGIEIICVNEFIPNDSNARMPDVTCSSRISINLFSNILDIKSLSLYWLANKISSLAAVNYNICVGPKFVQNTNTRINDFCGYFNSEEFFSRISSYPYAYTTRTHHAYGCETRCFVHKRENSLNTQYSESYNDDKLYDPYDYATDVLDGLVDEEILKFYAKLRRECDASYDVLFRPVINCDTVDFLLVSKTKGIVLLNICNDLSSLNDCFNRVQSIKDNIFNIYLRTIKIDSIMYSSVYNCVKTGLYFPNSNITEINNKIQQLNQEKNAGRKSASSADTKETVKPKDYFAYLQVITKQTKLQETLGRLNSKGYKYEYFEELMNLISAEWHSYKEGDLYFRLTPRQKEIVRSNSSRLRIKGVAGCGKTQVVANRAVEQHLKTGDRVLIITFNISLVQYIKMRIRQVPADFALNMFEITNYHQFFKSKANQYAGKNLYLNDFDNANYFDSYRDKIKKYKTIIIDEIQDFNESWIQLICNNFLEDGGSISVFGDGEQNIYDRKMEVESKMPSLRGCGFPGGQWGKMSERLSMRIRNPQIASLSTEFARQFISPETEYVATQQEINFGNDHHIKYWNIKRESTAITITSNIMWIMETFNIKPKDLVVLGQSITLLRDIDDTYSKAVKVQSMINFETKTQYDIVKKSSPMYFWKDLEEIRRAAKTHFTTVCRQLKLSTIQSFKGWESNSIILILQPEMNRDEIFDGYKIQDRENTPALIYTALTRAKCNLFIINLGNSTYNQFFYEQYTIVMDITLQAKRIIFQILVLIMRADSIIKEEEISFLNNVFTEFGLSYDEFDHMDDLDIDYLIREFALLPRDCKAYAKGLFLQMAQCDGFVDPREMAIINKLY